MDVGMDVGFRRCTDVDTTSQKRRLFRLNWTASTPSVFWREKCRLVD